jgi:hypothetical protein
MMISFFCAGILSCGGYFQSNYAKEFKDKWDIFLKTNELESGIKEIKAQTILLSLSANIACDKCEHVGLKAFSKWEDKKRAIELKKIPNISGKDAVTKSAVSVLNYLNKVDPSYVCSPELTMS